MVKGKCLCGGVEFELGGELPDLYQCHCSLCRRVTGSSANAALILEREQFRWLRGEQLVSTYQTGTGYKSHFCSSCGCPLPNPTRGDSAWWIPVGLLDDTDEIRVAAHVYCGSRAQWDVMTGESEGYDAMPDTDTFQRLFGPKR